MASPSDVTPDVSLVVAAAILGSAPERTERALESIRTERVSAAFVIGGGAAMQRIAAAAGAVWVKSVHDLLEELDTSVSHVWLLHDDARPLPGALGALTFEAHRVDASMAGSKLLDANDHDLLESVGGATDVFGVPYTGLQPGELDQEQYDVVRDVAFIPGASVLVRRDLLRGLQGPDPLLPPVASGIDLAQRARLAGGRVVVVPSSEVLHEGSCAAGAQPWREQAGQYRAMLKAYAWLTLVWVLPAAVLIDLVDGLARLAMGSPRALSNDLKALLWNLKNARSGLTTRFKAQSVRSAGDEELFRYQLSGSVRLRQLGEDLTEWFRERSSPDGAVSTWMERRRGFWQEPAFLAAFLAVAAVLVAGREILSSGLPVTGYALPLPDDAWQALRDVAVGWNPAGLGAPGPMHPAVAAAAALALPFFGRSAMAATAVTLGSVVAAYFGFSRLVGRFEVGPSGRIGGGLAAALGPVILGVGSTGYWPALVGIGAVPWAIDAAWQPLPRSWRKRAGRIGLGILTTGVMTSFVPLAAGVPVVVLGLWFVFGSDRRWGTMLRAVGFGAVSLVFLGQTLYWSSLRTLLVGGQAMTWELPGWMVALGAATLLASILIGSNRSVSLGTVGGLLALGGVWLARAVEIGIGVEVTAVGFVLAAVGVSLSVAAAVDLPASVGAEGRGRRVLALLGAGAAAALVVGSFVALVADGRVGFGEDRFGASLAFTEARSDAHGPDRVLYVGADLPGEARVMMGTEFRVGSAPEVPLAEAWLPLPRAGDRALETTLRKLAGSDELRPGAALAEFGIRWVVSTSPNALETAFVSRLDMKRLPLYEDQPYTVYENLEPSPRAVSSEGSPWSRAGIGYEGVAVDSTVRIAENFDERWTPEPARVDWAVEVSADRGSATVQPDSALRLLALLAGAVASLALVAALASLGGKR